jgi:predicted P-loop ATPase
MQTITADDSRVVFSHHASATDQPHGGFASIDEVWALLRNPSPDTVARVAAVRKRAATATKHSDLGALKARLPAVTFSAKMSCKGEDGFVAHTGYYVYDYDELPDLTEAFDTLASCKLDCMAGVFVSPSGEGLKVVLQGPVAQSPGEHRTLWRVGMGLLRCAAPIEIAEKDRADEVSRLCFLSDCRGPNSIWTVDWYEPFAAVRAASAASVPGVADISDLDADDVEVGGLTLDEVRERLWCVSADCGYQEWVRMVMAVVQTLGKTDEAKALVRSWSQECGGEKGKWSRADERTFDTLWGNAEQRTSGSGVDRRYIDRVARKAGYRDWFADLRRDVSEKGVVKIVGCEYNIGLVLDHHPELRGRIWCDEVSGRVLLEPKAGCVLARGAIVERDVAWTIVEWLQTKWSVKVCSAEGMLDAMFAKGKGNTRNKRREWLLSLAWDGTERVAGLWVDGFGSPDSPLVRGCAETWMIGAAARTLRPGTDFQLVPILQSPQGRGKSLGIAALCPDPEWFIDSQIDMRSKAGYEVVRTGTIIELAELSSMGRAESEAVKAFISHRSFTYRGAYDRQTTSVPVAWVFVGTTNEVEVLKDTTGNRRFVPVLAPGRNGDWEQTTAWVRANREQLWAEAAHKAKSITGSVVLPKHLWLAQRAAAEGATSRDVAEDVIEDLSERTEIGSTMAMTSIMSQVPGGNIASKADQMRVASYLHKYGWRRGEGVIEGVRRRCWRKTL